MARAHELILLGGALGLLSIVPGLLLARGLRAPLLVMFLLLGMLAGEDGPLGLRFEDYGAAYLIGSIALVLILFEGGLSVERAVLRPALGPALLLATLGVAVTAAAVGLGGWA